MIRYVDSLDGIRLDMLHGFFEGWRRSVSLEEHLELLRGGDHVVLALDDGLNVEALDTDSAPDTAATPGAAADRVVGFITAISDGVLSAYIPLLEVLPDYRG